MIAGVRYRSQRRFLRADVVVLQVFVRWRAFDVTTRSIEDCARWRDARVEDLMSLPEGVAHPSAQDGEGASGAEGDAKPTNLPNPRPSNG